MCRKERKGGRNKPFCRTGPSAVEAGGPEGKAPICGTQAVPSKDSASTKEAALTKEAVPAKEAEPAKPAKAKTARRARASVLRDVGRDVGQLFRQRR